VAEHDPRDQLIAELMAKVEALTARVAELEARLAQNSHNSSRPPSSDGPGAAPRTQKATGRKPGGQPGHKGHKRGRIPRDQVTKTVKLTPKACFNCHGPVRPGDQEPRWHQVIELPPIRPHVTEYQMHVGYCAGCQAWTWAELPKNVSRSAFGPRLTCMVGLLSGRYRQSKRLMQDFLSSIMGVRISLGSVSKLESKVSAALEKPVEEVKHHLKEQAVAHLDETGWRERLGKAWLWVAVAGHLAVFLIRQSRGAAVAKELLGEGFRGHLVTDRWSAYTWVDPQRRQICWSHLERDFTGFVERGGRGGLIGAELLLKSKRMFKLWHRVRDGTLKRRTFQRRMEPIRARVELLLKKAEAYAEPKTAGMAREMLTLKQALFTFVDVEGIEPTNNTAERTIRPAVIYRKLSFGTHSKAGSRFIERMMTVTATLKLQKRNVLEYLTAAYAAHLAGAPAPSLLPASAPALAIAA
jgi:transposase